MGTLLEGSFASDISLSIAAVDQDVQCAECRQTVICGQRVLQIERLHHPTRYVCRQHAVVAALGGPHPVRVDDAVGRDRGQHVWHLPDVEPDTLDFLLSRILAGDVVTVPYDASPDVDTQLRERAAARHMGPIGIRHRNEGASK